MELAPRTHNYLLTTTRYLLTTPFPPRNKSSLEIKEMSKDENKKGNSADAEVSVDRVKPKQ